MLLFALNLIFFNPSLFPSQPSAIHIYLLSALPDQGDKLGDDQVYTFQTGVFQLNDLLFHYSLKRQVWGEQACPVMRHHGSQRFEIGRKKGNVADQNEKEGNDGSTAKAQVGLNSLREEKEMF